MEELKLIHGKRSIRYNLFRDYTLAGCRAVCARLMGVVALKISWRSRNDEKALLYQILHLDYSEYGIDEYREFECIPGEDDYKLKKDSMKLLWDRFTSVMGSELTDISAPCMLRLIESALRLCGDDINRSYDSEENADFRRYALLRLGLMKEALSEDGIDSESCSEEEAIAELSPLNLTAFETINYFIMRLVDRDFPAAKALSSIDMEDLRSCELASPGRQTLVSCSIAISDRRKDPPSDGESYPFRCRITTEAEDAYYHSTFVIWLSGNHRAKNPLVTEVKVGSLMKLSEYEAALQMNRNEYITVFKCSESMLAGFDIRYIFAFEHSLSTTVPNGILFTAYKRDNSHVDSSEYRLEGDVLGYALLSIAGELILMSHDLHSITKLDDSAIFSIYSPSMTALGRYRLDTSVFQTLCTSEGLIFDDLVEPEPE